MTATPRRWTTTTRHIYTHPPRRGAPGSLPPSRPGPPSSKQVRSCLPEAHQPSQERVGPHRVSTHRPQVKKVTPVTLDHNYQIRLSSGFKNPKYSNLKPVQWNIWYPREGDAGFPPTIETWKGDLWKRKAMKLWQTFHQQALSRAQGPGIWPPNICPVSNEEGLSRGFYIFTGPSCKRRACYSNLKEDHLGSQHLAVLQAEAKIKIPTLKKLGVEVNDGSISNEKLKRRKKTQTMLKRDEKNKENHIYVM